MGTVVPIIILNNEIIFNTYNERILYENNRIPVWMLIIYIFNLVFKNIYIILWFIKRYVWVLHSTGYGAFRALQNPLQTTYDEKLIKLRKTDVETDRLLIRAGMFDIGRRMIKMLFIVYKRNFNIAFAIPNV